MEQLIAIQLTEADAKKKYPWCMERKNKCD